MPVSQPWINQKERTDKMQRKICRKRKKMTVMLLAGLIAAESAMAAAMPISAAERQKEPVYKVINGDFETGDFTGWTLQDGSAITNETNDTGVISQADTYWGTRNYYKEGSCFLSGAEKENNSGTIRSSCFTLGGEGYISFLIGSAATQGKGCIKLMKEDGDNDVLIKTYINDHWSDPATGNTLLRVYDRLEEYLGEEMYFVIENGTEPGFSFINADDFQTSLTLKEVKNLYRSDVERVKKNRDEYEQDILALYKDVTFYGTAQKVGEGLDGGSVSVEEKMPEMTERIAGYRMNVEETIREATKVRDEFGMNVPFSVQVNSVKYEGANVAEDWKEITLAEGVYTVEYTLNYESKGQPVSLKEQFGIKVTKPQIRQTIQNGDFETGDLTGWMLLNGAKATNDNNPVGVVSNDSHYWGERALYQHGNYVLRGDVKENQSGAIRSASFTLGGDGYLSFLIGTGADEGKGCVKLYREDEGKDTLVKTYTNKHWNDPKTGLTLIRLYDQLDDIGKTFYFVVENGNKAGFSFISVDDFRTSLTRQEVMDLQQEELERISGIRDEYREDVIACYRKNGIINELLIEEEIGDEIKCYEGVKLDLSERIRQATRIVKSYSGERAQVNISIDRVISDGIEVEQAKEEFIPKAGTYSVEYTRSYGDITEKKQLLVKVTALDDSVRDVRNGSFETGDLEGWEVLNEAVWSTDETGKYKGVISAKEYWGERLPYNQDGNYHLNGWEVTGEETAEWGIRSSAFTLSGSGFISVRMGGHAAQMRVYRIDGTLIGTYRQNRFADHDFPFVGRGGSWADMGTYFVDLHEHLGETIYIELWDQTVSGGWAVAFFDSVKGYYETEPDIAAGFDTVTGPVEKQGDNTFVYDTIQIPWKKLSYSTEVLKLSFEDEGFEIANSSGNKTKAELNSVFKNPKYQDKAVEPYRPDGVSGKALNFDGYSNFASFEESVEGSALTIDAYVCPRVFIWDSPETDRREQIAQIIAGSYDEKTKRGFLLGVTKHGYLAFRLGTADAWYALASEQGKRLPTYEWSRVSAVFDGKEGQMSLYLNGEPAGNMKIEAGSELADSGLPIMIGKGSRPVIVADNLFDGTMFCGLMDEVTITREAFDAEQIAQKGVSLPKISYQDAMAPDSALAGDYYRPVYHAVPSGNWMNEPHALFSYNGKWHLFYQINPAGPYWHNISWGHWVSDDMVQWKYVKEAVIPTEGTIAPDGIWTGNVIFTSDGKPMLLITAGDDARSVNGSNQHVGLVRADDYDDPELTDWTIVGYAMAQGPQMGTPGEFRDAQAFGLDGERYMVVGGADNARGVAHVFKTTAGTLADWEAACSGGDYNGMKWEYKGDLFGDFFASHPYKEEYGRVWEMPNLVPLPYENGEESGKYLFVFSPQGGDNDVWYYIGEFDTKQCRFVPDEPEAKRMDYGNNIFTGPTVYKNPSDGKVYICSIMQENAQGDEIARPIAEHEKAGWAFYAGLPRELYLRPDKKTLGIRHIDTSSVEGEILADVKEMKADEANGYLKEIDSDCVKIDFTFKGDASRVGLRLKKAGDSAATLYLTKSQLGLDRMAGDYTRAQEVSGTVYVDKCSIEAYIDNCITISGSKYIRGGGIEVFTEGDAVCSIKVTAMKSIHTGKQEDPGANAAAQLAAAKTYAIERLDDYSEAKAKADATEAEKTAYDKAVADGKDAINAAEDQEAVAEAFTQAKAAVDAALAKIDKDRADAAAAAQEMAEADQAVADAKTVAETAKTAADEAVENEYASDADKTAIGTAKETLEAKIKAANELAENATAEQKNAAAKEIEDAVKALNEAVDTANVNSAAKKAEAEEAANAAAQLAAAKTYAIERLDDYSEAKAKADATEAEKTAYDKAVADGKDAINAAEDQEAVAEAFTQAKAAVDTALAKIDKDRADAAAAAQEMAEADQAVADAKTVAETAKTTADEAAADEYASGADKIAIGTAKETLEAKLKAAKNLPETATAEAKNAAAKDIEDAVKALNAAVDTAVVNSAAAKAKAEEEATAAAEQLAAAKKAAKERLEDVYDAKNQTDYRAAQQKELADAREAGYQAIEEAATPAEALEALAAAKEALNAVKTDAQLTKEEKEAADTKAALASTKQIGEIPASDSVKLADKAAIEAARKAYDALSADQKGKVDATTKKKLESAEAALKKLEDALANAKKAASAAMSKPVKVKAKTKGIKVNWTTCKEADGYDVYVQYAGKKFKKVTKNIKKSTTGKTKVLKIGGKKLNRKKDIRVYVSAYKMIDGKKVILANSKVATLKAKRNSK